jgi:hypothetical protein
MTSARKRPLDFRKDEVAYVMSRWQTGGSCALVGVPSVGKSNLLLHLDDPDVQAHYLRDSAANLKTVIVDHNMLGPLQGADNEPQRCWAGYELLMHRLYLSLYPFTMLTDDERKYLEGLYNAIHDGSNPIYAYMGLRYLELALELFTRRDMRIVFLFDEFDEMLRQMPVKFFQNLRGLRDANRRNILFLTFSRVPLRELSGRLKIPPLEIEPFIELFTDNVLFVGPFNEVDAGRMVNELNQNRNYTPGILDALAGATGRFAGLLRAGFKALADVDQSQITLSPTPDQISALIVTRTPVRTECNTIWISLNPSEQAVLRSVAGLPGAPPFKRTPESEQAVTLLLSTGLLAFDPARQSLEVNPPILRRYLTQYASQL